MTAPCPHLRPWYLHPTDKQPSHWWCALRETVCTTEHPGRCPWRRGQMQLEVTR